jgi:hypothetical protein
MQAKLGGTWEAGLVCFGRGEAIPLSRQPSQKRAVAKRVRSLDLLGMSRPKGYLYARPQYSTEGGAHCGPSRLGRVSQRGTTGLRRGHLVGLDRGCEL